MMMIFTITNYLINQTNLLMGFEESVAASLGQDSKHHYEEYIQYHTSKDHLYILGLYSVKLDTIK